PDLASIGPQRSEKHHLGSLRRSRVSPVSPAISSRVPTYIQFAARYTVPRWRCGSTKVSSNTTPCPKASSQSPGKRLCQSERTRDPKLKKCPSGRIRKRLLLTTSFKRP